MGLRQHVATLTVELGMGPDIRDLTAELNRLVAAAGIREGLLALSVVGSTGSVTTIH